MIFVKMVASFFFVGYAPWAPGTFGSFAACLLIRPCQDFLPFLTLGLSIVGLLICAPAQKAFGRSDPSRFVLDEVCGMLLGVLWLPPSPGILISAFLLFRALDIWKPWPISWCERRPHPQSIMWDDLAAGVVVNLLLQAIVRFL